MSRHDGIELDVYAYDDVPLALPGLLQRVGVRSRERPARDGTGTLATGFAMVASSVQTRPRIGVETPEGRISFADLVARIRPGWRTSKGERALVDALQVDDPDALNRIPVIYPGVAPAATVAMALRSIDIDADRSLTPIAWVLDQKIDPARIGFFSKHFPGLRGAVSVFSGLEVDLPLGTDLLRLLAADVLRARSREHDALAMTDGTRGWGAMAIRAALMNVTGDHQGVLTLADGARPDDPLGAAVLVERASALRATGAAEQALDLLSSLIDGGCPPVIYRRALAERVHAHLDANRLREALADHTRLLASMTNVPAALERARGLLEALVQDAPDDHVPSAFDLALERARERVRSRPRVDETPGHYGGRHHETYRVEVAEMVAGGQQETAERTLLGLLDAVEDEARELDGHVETHFYRNLADVYRNQGDLPGEVAVLERFNRSAHGTGPDVDSLLGRYATRRQELLDSLTER